MKKLLFFVKTFAACLCIIAVSIAVIEKPNRLAPLVPIHVEADEIRSENTNVWIASAKNNCCAIYTMISDDGYYDSGVIQNELCKKYDLHTTVAGVVNIIERNLEGWKNIVADGYIELVSHSYEHFPMYIDDNAPDEKYELNIAGSKKWIEDNFGYPVISFVCPENECNEKGYEYIQKAGYYSVRRGTPGENKLSPEDGTEPRAWLNLGKRGISDAETTQERNVWVDDAIKNRSWLIEMWHQITPNGDFGYGPITTQAADEHLSYVAEMRNKGYIWVASFQEATRYIKEKQHTTVELLEQANGDLVIRMDCNRDVLPEELFNDELTLVFMKPSGWKEVAAVQNGVAREVKDRGDGYCFLNAPPNGYDIILTEK